MKKYTGKRETPMFGGSAQRLQEIWFALMAFLLFAIDQGEEAGWEIEELGIPPGVWPIPEPHKMPCVDLEVAKKLLIGSVPEGSGARGQTGQIQHILRLMDSWDSAVDQHSENECKAIAMICPDALRDNWNLFNSISFHISRIAGERIYRPMLWRPPKGESVSAGDPEPPEVPQDPEIPAKQSEDQAQE